MRFSLEELLGEVGPDAKGCHGEEEEEKGGVEGAEEGAGGGDEEDIEGSDHGSDGEVRPLAVAYPGPPLVPPTMPLDRRTPA